MSVARLQIPLISPASAPAARPLDAAGEDFQRQLTSAENRAEAAPVAAPSRKAGRPVERASRPGESRADSSARESETQAPGSRPAAQSAREAAAGEAAARPEATAETPEVTPSQGPDDGNAGQVQLQQVVDASESVVPVDLAATTDPIRVDPSVIAATLEMPAAQQVAAPSNEAPGLEGAVPAAVPEEPPVAQAEVPAVMAEAMETQAPAAPTMVAGTPLALAEASAGVAKPMPQVSVPRPRSAAGQPPPSAVDGRFAQVDAAAASAEDASAPVRESQAPSDPLDMFSKALPEARPVAAPAGAAVSDTFGPLLASMSNTAVAASDGQAASPSAPPVGSAAAQASPGPDGQPALDEPDQANLARVARGLQAALAQRGGQVTLRLQPPELGLVRIEMSVRDGMVRAALTTEQESVSSLLHQQLGHLRAALERQGLWVERLEVQTLPPSSGSNAAQQRGGDGAAHDGRSQGQHLGQPGGQSARDHADRGAEAWPGRAQPEPADAQSVSLNLVG